MRRRNDDARCRIARIVKVTCAAAMLATLGNAVVASGPAEAGSFFDRLFKKKSKVKENDSRRRQKVRRRTSRKVAKRPLNRKTISKRSVTQRAGSKGSKSYQVGVFGDSLGDGLYVGLTNLARSTSGVKVHRFSRVNTGLARRDRYDWVKAAEKLSRKRMDVAVLSFGANDVESIRDRGRTYDYRTKGWETRLCRPRRPRHPQLPQAAHEGLSGRPADHPGRSFPGRLRLSQQDLPQGRPQERRRLCRQLGQVCRPLRPFHAPITRWTDASSASAPRTASTSRCTATATTRRTPSTA